MKKLLCVLLVTFLFLLPELSFSNEILNTTKPVSIAVLPLNNKTGNSSLDWLSIGLQDAMTVDLWYISGFRAIALPGIIDTVGKSLKELTAINDNEAAELGKKLNLDYIVVGSYELAIKQSASNYQPSEKEIIITIRIVKTGTSEEVFVHKVSTSINNLSEEESEVVLTLAKSLHVHVKPEEKERIKSLKTKSLKAWELNAKGFEKQIEYQLASKEKQESITKEWKDYLEQSVKEDPLYAEAWNNLGYAYSILSEKENALKTFQKAVEIKPYLIDSLAGLGASYNEIGQKDQAVQHLKKTVKLNPSLPENHSSLAAVHEDMEKWEEAMKEYEEVIRLKPNSAYSRSRKGFCLYKLKRLDEAVQAYERASQLCEDVEEKASYTGTSGVILFNNKKYEESYKKYSEAVSLTKDKQKKALYTAYSADALAAMGKLEEANSLYEQAISMTSDQEEQYNYLIKSADLKRKMKKSDEALKDYEKALAISQVLKEKNPNLESVVLTYIGNIYFKDKEDYSKAVEIFKKAHEIYSTKGDEGEANILASIANSYTEKGDYEIAIQYLLLAEQLDIRNKSPHLGWTYLFLYAAYEGMHDYEKSQEFLKKAKEFLVSNNDKELEAKIKDINNLTPEYSNLLAVITAERVKLGQGLISDIEKALENYADMANEGGYKDLAAFALITLGEFYFRKGDFRTFLIYHEKALNTLQSPMNDNEYSVKAAIYLSLGRAYYELGWAQKGETYLQQAFSYAVVRNLKKMLLDIQIEAMSHNLKLQYDGNEILQSFENLSSLFLARYQIIKANHYVRENLWDKAIEEYTEALNYAKSYDSSVGVDGLKDNICIDIFQNKEITIIFLGDIETGEQMLHMIWFPEIFSQSNRLTLTMKPDMDGLKRCIELQKKSSGLLDKKKIEDINPVELLLNIKSVCPNCNMKEQPGENSPFTRSIMLQLANAYLGTNNIDKSSELFKKVLPEAEKYGDKESLWKAKRGLGACLVAEGKKEEALSYYKEAVEILEGLRKSLSSLPVETRTAYMQERMYVYEEYVKLLMELHREKPSEGYDKNAWHVAERSRARGLLDMLTKTDAIIQSGVPKDYAEKERQMNIELVNIENGIIKLKSDVAQMGKTSFNIPILFGGDPKERLKELDARKAELEKSLAELEVDIEKNYPRYAELKYPKPMMVEDIQSIIEKDEAVVEYFVTDNLLGVWVITKDEVKLEILPIKKDELETKVKAYYELYAKDTKQKLFRLSELYKEFKIADTGRRKEIKAEIEGLKREMSEAILVIQEKGNEIYRMIFLPIEDLLTGKKITIIPHEVLFYLSFESLTYDIKLKDDGYLINKYSISYLPSASVLKSIRKEEEKKSSQPLIAFADPYYGDIETPSAFKGSESGEDIMRSLVMRSYADRGFKFRPLPDTRDEAIAVADTTKADKDRDLYLDKKAAEGEIKGLNRTADLSKYRYLLFSTHGIIGGEISYVNQPAIVLSLGIPQDDDGFLQMNEIFNLSLNADLVTLSACKTALGDDIKGEGLVGLSRAFMYAGARALNVTLWEVESKSAKELVVGMYKYLSQGKDKAEALKQAKLDMLNGKNELYRHPFFWSPFVLIGDWK